MSARFKKSLADVTRRKGRTLLVVLGIFIGVAGMTTINVTEEQLSAAYAFTAGSHTAQPDITLIVDRLDPALLPTLSGVPNVKTVQDTTIVQTQWHVREAPGHVGLTITSYPDLQHVPLTPFELIGGREPAAGEVVMEYGDLALQPVHIGDLVTVDTTPGTTRLRVVGIARTPGADPATSGKAMAYMSDAGLQQLPVAPYAPGAVQQGPLLLHQIAFKFETIARGDATVATLQRLLRSHQIAVLGAIPGTGAVPLGQLHGIFTLLLVLVLLAALLSAILLLHTVTTFVGEQTAIMGTMKAIGGTRGVILRTYLVSVTIYSVVATGPGLMCGFVMGYGLASGLAATVPLALGPFDVAPWILAAGLAIGLGVPLAVALVPLWTGTHISVRDALAAYGVSSVRVPRPGSPLLWLGRRLTWISQTTWLGLRGLLRRRWRAALTLVTLTLAGTSFLVVQTTTASVNQTIGSVWSNIAADVEVYVGDQVTFSQIRAQLSALSNVRRIERVGWAGGQIPWGKLAIWGFEPDTQLYHAQLTSGRWLRDDDTNVVLLSDDTAERTGLRIGDTLTVTGPDGHTLATWAVIGTVRQSVDDLSQIGAAVVPVNTLYELEGAPAATVADFTNRVVIQAQDRSPAAVSQLTDTIDALGRAAATSGGGARGGGIAEVFVFHDEVVRHQRNFLPLYVLLYAAALAVGTAGLLGLADALAASVVARRREIGLLRAMGASSRRVAQVFWIEGLCLAGTAACAGSLLGFPLALAFLQLFRRVVIPVDFVADPRAFAVMLVAVLAIATLASVVPAVRASRLRVAEILRYE